MGLVRKCHLCRKYELWVKKGEIATLSKNIFNTTRNEDLNSGTGAYIGTFDKIRDPIGR